MANPPTKSMACITLLVLLFTGLQVEGREEMAGIEQKQDIRRRSSAPSSKVEEYLPVRSVVYRRWVWAADETPPHRPFLVCSGRCRCCAPSNSSNCVDDTPCCFGIKCNIPGKPYGTCAFQPVSCGCDSCPSQPPSSSHLLSSSEF